MMRELKIIMAAKPCHRARPNRFNLCFTKYDELMAFKKRATEELQKIKLRLNAIPDACY